MNLGPRHQGRRGTCSVFTTAAVMEYELSKQLGKTVLLSVEYLNWAANEAKGRPTDGQFFHTCLRGYRWYGISTEEEMPYQESFDPKHAPSAAVKASAMKLRQTNPFRIRWIKRWRANDTGINEEQMQQIKQALAAGHPVAAGASHSRVLVGYEDDPNQPGGGIFRTKDSGSGRFSRVTYEFVYKNVNDAFWVEVTEASATR